MKLIKTFILASILLSACSHKTNHTLRWKTASEFQNYGYDVYRSDFKDGPFEKVTKTPIIGAGTTDIISAYSFTDTGLKKGKSYYYYIESISENGKRKKFTPTRKTTIKKQSD